MKKPKTTTKKRPFNCLPEEIIIEIFDKISDAKSLCLCSLVSKKFCSLVLETHIVSVKIPSWVRASSFSQSLSSPLDISNFGTSASMIKFLEKFSRIESITIHLDFDGNPVLEPLVKWSFNGYGFLFVSAEETVDVGVGVGVGVDVDVDKAVNSDSSGSNLSILGNANVLKMFENIRQYYLKDVRYRIRLIHTIITKFAGLKNVILLDSIKEGRIFWNIEGIASMLNNASHSGEPEPFRIKIWHTPLLRLPLTGCVVKEATVVGFDVGDDDRNCFEDKLFSELAVVLMKKKTSYDVISHNMS